MWNSYQDHFQFSIPQGPVDGRVTKRTILSDVAQVFDPLGLINPIIIDAKIIIQELWKLKSGWDESIPIKLHTKWFQYRKQLHLLENLRIPRQCMVVVIVVIFCVPNLELLH